METRSLQLSECYLHNPVVLRIQHEQPKANFAIIKLETGWWGYTKFFLERGVIDWAGGIVKSKAMSSCH